MKPLGPVERDLPRELDDDEDEEDRAVGAGARARVAGSPEGAHGSPEPTYCSVAAGDDEGASPAQAAPALVPSADLEATDDRRHDDPLAAAPAELHGSLSADLHADPSLNLRLRGSSAHLALDTRGGRLDVHVRLDGSDTQVRLTGVPAAALAARGQELSRELDRYGLSLTSIAVDGDDHPAPAGGESSPPEPSDRAPIERRRRRSVRVKA